MMRTSFFVLFTTLSSFAFSIEQTPTPWAFATDQVLSLLEDFNLSDPRQLRILKQACSMRPPSSWLLAQPDLGVALALCQSACFEQDGALRRAEQTLLEAERLFLNQNLSPSVRAQLYFRLAHMEHIRLLQLPLDDALLFLPIHFAQTSQIREQLKRARSAYERVAKANDPEWSGYAAQAVAQLTDAVMSLVGSQCNFVDLDALPSPLEVWFHHTLSGGNLRARLSVLEEKTLALSSLLQSAPGQDVCPIDCQENIQSPFEPFVKPGTIVLIQKHFYQLGPAQKAKPLTDADAMVQLERLSKGSLRTFEAALALGLLAEKDRKAKASDVAELLLDNRPVFRLIGLRIAERAPDPLLVDALLVHWAHISDDIKQHRLFGNMQNALFGEAERTLMALAASVQMSHISAQKILNSKVVSDAHRAWLIAFRPDPKLRATAERLQSSKDPLAAMRARALLWYWP